MKQKKKTSDHKTGFDSGGECRRLNENLIKFDLYGNVRSSNLLRRRDDQWSSIWEFLNSKKRFFHMDGKKNFCKAKSKPRQIQRNSEDLITNKWITQS